MTRNPARDRLRLAIVDGFAGGGEYEDELTGRIVPGSPQILIDAVREAEAVANIGRRKPVHVNATFHFVERHPTTVSYLRDVLGKRADWKREVERVQVHQGAFEDHLDRIIVQIQRGGRVNRALFVLDQYGYTAVPVSLVERIFRALPHAEVFLTLAVGWITAYLPTLGDAAIKLGVPQETIDRICRDGDEALNIDDPSRRPDLLAVQRLLQRVFTTSVGSLYYTPFFIVSRDSHRAYWFLHLANSPKAHDVVKALHWGVENHFEHFGGAGLGMLGYNPRLDPNIVGQLPLFRFDEPARERARAALLVALPERIRERFPNGVPFSSFVSSVCNETPATEAHLAEIVRQLCVEQELTKRGAKGENRAPETLPRSDDILQMPPQRTLFPLRFGRRSHP